MKAQKVLSPEMMTQVMEKVKRYQKRLIERLSKEERSIYLEQAVEDKANGFYERDLLTSIGLLEDLRVPRTRSGEFYPALLPGRRRASVDLGDLVLLLFQHGINTRKIQAVIESIYGTYYSHTSLSKLTRITKEEIDSWRRRTLKERYLVVYIDALFLSLKRGSFEKEPVYVAMGLDDEGRREILGFWLFGSEGESANLWREIVAELKGRGVKDVSLFVSDDLPGIEEVTKIIYPDSKHQLCILHAVRNSLKRARRQDKEEVAITLKSIYRSVSRQEAEVALRSFKQRWSKTYPSIVRYWTENSPHLLRFLDYPSEIRPYIYTTNYLERLFKEVKRRTKTIEVFSSEDSLINLLYLVLKSENERLQKRRLKGFSCYEYLEEE